MTAMYSPAYLNYHADRFVAMRISAHGVTLEQYLVDPARYEHLATEPEPLLPEQRAAAARIEAEEAEARLGRELQNLPSRNGSIIERLRHCRRHRRAPSVTNFTKRRRVS